MSLDFNPHGTIDLQVNGYGGVDLNNEALTAEELHAACVLMQQHGVSYFLATVITDQIEVMSRRLRRLVELRAADPLATAMIPGFHIEGPFISPEAGYRGAHPVDAIRPTCPDAMKTLLEAADGLTCLVTLAPEQDPGAQVTAQLVKAGVAVSAGHTNASLDELRATIDAGLSLFTHLGNGCPMQMHRHENIVQRALHLREHLTLCFIADGVHVPFTALSNYLALAGLERSLVVTDAMTAAGLGPGRHRLGRWEVEVGEDLAAWAPDRSHLVGSAMSMPQAEKNLRDALGLSEENIRRLVCDTPRRILAGTNAGSRLR